MDESSEAAAEAVQLRSQTVKVDLPQGATGIVPGFVDGRRGVEAKIPSAQSYADLMGVLGDLRQTIDYCNAFLRVSAYPLPEPPDPGSPPIEDWQRTIEDALWSSALISYWRAFGTGVRKEVRLTPAIFDEVENASDHHKHFSDLRSKYVAHSVNALEQLTTVVLLPAPLTTEHDMSSIDIGIGSGRITPLNEDGVLVLRRLAEIAAQWVLQRIGEMGVTVRTELDQAGLKVIATWPPYELVIPDVEAMGKARSL